MKKKKNKKSIQPIRTCIVTREKKNKNAFVRLVYLKDEDKIVVNTGRKNLSGRGANILPDIKIFDKAIKKNILKRALKINRIITMDEIQILRKDFIKAIERKILRENNKNIEFKINKSEYDKIILD